jgi:hypothetical protein
MTNRRRYLVSGLVMISVVSLFMLLRPDNSTSLQVGDTLVKGSADALERIDGVEFSAYVPQKFRILRSDSPKGSLANELYFLSKKDHRSAGQIGITAGKLLGSSIDELPSVRIRSEQNGYTTQKTNSYKDSVLVLTKNDDTEITVYLQKNDSYASISLSESTSSENIAALHNIVDSWGWK